MLDTATPLTTLLHAWQAGDAGALDQLLSLVHGELQRMARSRLKGADTPSLAPDDLLQESLLKLFERRPDWGDRAHFFASVSLTMRSVLVDHARARMSAKRGGDWRRLTYTLSAHGQEDQVADLLTLDTLLRRLAVQDPRAAEILELTYFAGLERQDIALTLGLSVPTVDRELRFARAWLSAELGRSSLEA